jgi:hypothetical protein
MKVKTHLKAGQGHTQRNESMVTVNQTNTVST